MNPKELLGNHIAQQITADSLIAVGTGSTVDAAIRALGRRIDQEKIAVRVVPTSYETAVLCSSMGCTVLSMEAIPDEIAWGFDGADEVDECLNLLKGRGGALLREKVVASHCRRFTILVDDTKLVKRLGERYAVPIEVVPGAVTLVTRKLVQLGAIEVTLRPGHAGKHGPAITESGNLILDTRFPRIEEHLPHEIKAITGVVEHGIFFALCSEVLIASSDGRIETRRRSPAPERISD